MSGDENLIAVQLYLVALQVDIAVHLGEVEYACEMEGEVYVEVYPEHGLLKLHGIQRVVEFLIVFVFE